MASRTPRLSPEEIRRRKRQMLPRAPEITLGERARELKTDEDELQKLLEELVYYAERETLFTMTLERPRLMSALFYAGFIGSIFYNYEGQIAPGATITAYLPVPAGFVLSPVKANYYSSLPWWLSIMIWVDSDLPALPAVALTRVPDYYPHIFHGLSSMRRFMRFTVTNNHALNTVNFLAIQGFDIMTITTWEMLEEIYLKPIIEYAQEQAEKLTGRPFP